MSEKRECINWLIGGKFDVPYSKEGDSEEDGATKDLMAVSDKYGLLLLASGTALNIVSTLEFESTFDFEGKKLLQGFDKRTTVFSSEVLGIALSGSESLLAVLFREETRVYDLEALYHLKSEKLEEEGIVYQFKCQNSSATLCKWKKSSASTDSSKETDILAQLHTNYNNASCLLVHPFSETIRLFDEEVLSGTEDYFIDWNPDGSNELVVAVDRIVAVIDTGDLYESVDTISMPEAWELLVEDDDCPVKTIAYLTWFKNDSMCVAYIDDDDDYNVALVHVDSSSAEFTIAENLYDIVVVKETLFKGKLRYFSVYLPDCDCLLLTANGSTKVSVARLDFDIDEDNDEDEYTLFGVEEGASESLALTHPNIDLQEKSYPVAIHVSYNSSKGLKPPKLEEAVEDSCPIVYIYSSNGLVTAAYLYDKFSKNVKDPASLFNSTIPVPVNVPAPVIMKKAEPTTAPALAPAPTPLPAFIPVFNSEPVAVVAPVNAFQSFQSAPAPAPAFQSNQAAAGREKEKEKETKKKEEIEKEKKEAKKPKAKGEGEFDDSVSGDLKILSTKLDRTMASLRKLMVDSKTCNGSGSGRGGNSASSVLKQSTSISTRLKNIQKLERDGVYELSANLKEQRAVAEKELEHFSQIVKNPTESKEEVLRFCKLTADAVHNHTHRAKTGYTGYSIEGDSGVSSASVSTFDHELTMRSRDITSKLYPLEERIYTQLARIAEDKKNEKYNSKESIFAALANTKEASDNLTRVVEMIDSETKKAEENIRMNANTSSSSTSAYGAAGASMREYKYDDLSGINSNSNSKKQSPFHRVAVSAKKGPLSTEANFFAPSSGSGNSGGGSGSIKSRQSIGTDSDSDSDKDKDNNDSYSDDRVEGDDRDGSDDDDIFLKILANKSPSKHKPVPAPAPAPAPASAFTPASTPAPTALLSGAVKKDTAGQPLIAKAAPPAAAGVFGAFNVKKEEAKPEVPASSMWGVKAVSTAGAGVFNAGQLPKAAPSVFGAAAVGVKKDNAGQPPIPKSAPKAFGAGQPPIAKTAPPAFGAVKKEEKASIWGAKANAGGSVSSSSTIRDLTKGSNFSLTTSSASLSPVGTGVIGTTGNASPSSAFAGSKSSQPLFGASATKVTAASTANDDNYKSNAPAPAPAPAAFSFSGGGGSSLFGNSGGTTSPAPANAAAPAPAAFSFSGGGGSSLFGNSGGSTSPSPANAAAPAPFSSGGGGSSLFGNSGGSTSPNPAFAAAAAAPAPVSSSGSGGFPTFGKPTNLSATTFGSTGGTSALGSSKFGSTPSSPSKMGMGMGMGAGAGGMLGGIGGQTSLFGAASTSTSSPASAAVNTNNLGNSSLFAAAPASANPSFSLGGNQGANIFGNAPQTSSNQFNFSSNQPR